MANPLKLSPQWIENQVLTEEYLIRGGRFMVCIIYTKGGYYVTGESAPINPAEFTEELGRKYSREEAIEKIWKIEGIIARKQHYGDDAEVLECVSNTDVSFWDQVPEGFDFLISSTAYGETNLKPIFHRYDAEEDRFVDAEGSHWGGRVVREQPHAFTVKFRPGVTSLPSSLEI